MYRTDPPKTNSLPPLSDRILGRKRLFPSLGEPDLWLFALSYTGGRRSRARRRPGPTVGPGLRRSVRSYYRSLPLRLWSMRGLSTSSMLLQLRIGAWTLALIGTATGIARPPGRGTRSDAGGGLVHPVRGVLPGEVARRRVVVVDGVVVVLGVRLWSPLWSPLSWPQWPPLSPAKASGLTASKPAAAVATTIPAFFSTVHLLLVTRIRPKPRPFEVSVRLGEPAPTGKNLAAACQATKPCNTIG